MIIERFKFSYPEVLKAVTGEHQQVAGAVAPSASGGATPAPQGQPRAGHKYTKRWWDGGRWQYEYAGEGQAQPHGVLQHGGEDTHDIPHPDPEKAQLGHKASVPKREHVLELPEGHQYGPNDAERAYHDTIANTLKPGTSHKVSVPNFGDLQIDVSRSGKLYGKKSDGSPLFLNSKGQPDPFVNYGQYEEWIRGQQAGPATLSDGNGKPWVKLVPLVGKVDKQSGMLQPSADKRRWKVVLHPDADPSMVPDEWKSKRDAVIATTTDKQGAWQAADQARRVMETKTGKPFGWQMGAAGAGGAPAPQQQAAPAMQQTVAQPAMQPQQQAQTAAGTPVMGDGPKPGIDHPDENVRAMSQIGWNEEPGVDPKTHQVAMLRKFAGTPEQKEQLVQKLSQKYSPVIFNTMKQMMARDPNLATPYWQERMMGGVQMGENTPILAEEGSTLHNALSRMIDRYDPSRTDATGKPLGLDAYISSSLPKDMERLLGEQRTEVYGGGSQGGGPVTARPKETSAATMGTRLSGGDSGGGSAGAGVEDEAQESPEDSMARIDNWKKMQSAQLYKLQKENPQAAPFVKQALAAVGKVNSDDHLDKFADVMQRYGHGDYIMNKALHKALWLMAMDIRKANAAGKPQFLSSNKKVDPTHTYAHRDGEDDHPRFFFRDPQNNFVRYTNAPSGHKDNVSSYGEASLHPSEPTAATAPQYYDPQGRKLTRAPEMGSQVQWNPNYHSNDPENLWIGRWVNPITGEHEHTYVDADMRMIPKMYLHQQIQLVDVRLPVLRKYIRSLFSSSMLKDKIVATALALVDQARFRAEEIGDLRVKDVQMYGALYDIGGRLVFGDHKFRAMMSLLTKNRKPQEPLFAVPIVKKDGKPDPMVIRNIGPHYIQSILEQMGLSLSGLLAYHATETFSREAERLLNEHDCPWESALEYATVAVAQEMGHDLSQEQNIAEILPVIRDMMIDPVVVEVLEQNAKDASLLGQTQLTLPLPPPAIMPVTFDLLTRTTDEQAFSKWLHTYPAHLHAEPMRPNLMEAPNAANGPSPVTQMNPLTQQSPQEQQTDAELGAIA